MITELNDIEVMKIPLAMIDLEHNHRAHIREDEVDGLMESIKKDGQLVPIIVTEKEKNRYKLLAGHRRYEACKKLKIDEINASVVSEKDSIRHKTINAIENLQRTDATLEEQAFIYNDFIENEGYTEKQVAQLLSVTTSRVKKVMSMLELTEEQRKNVTMKIGNGGKDDANKVGITMADRFAKACRGNNLSERKKDILWKCVQHGVATQKDLGKVAKMVLKGKSFNEIRKEKNQWVYVKVDMMVNKKYMEEQIKKKKASSNRGLVYGMLTGKIRGKLDEQFLRLPSN